MVMREKIGYYSKHIIRKMPDRIRHYGGYLYQASKTPFNFKKNASMFRYYTSVGKKVEIDYVPPIFDALISTACNLRCPTCLFILKDPDVFRGGGFIKVNDFKSIIDKCGPYTETVWLDGGEPLLHPELDKLLEIVKSNGLSPKISTNGILLSEKIEIMKFFDFVNVSMDGYNYETFKRFRGGTAKQFDSILDGLCSLRENNIKFMNSFMLTEENIADIYEMIKFAHEMKPDIIAFHNINPHGSKEYKPLTKSSEKAKQILDDITSKNDYPFDISLPVIFDTTSNHFKTAKCVQPWYYCCFDNEGNISYCCHLRQNPEIGNIFKGYNFNSDKMKNFRRLMINHQYPKDDCLYCQRRFAGEEYGFFNSRVKKWILS